VPNATVYTVDPDYRLRIVPLRLPIISGQGGD
jgi:hypothetical protein